MNRSFASRGDLRLRSPGRNRIRAMRLCSSWLPPWQTTAPPPWPTTRSKRRRATSLSPWSAPRISLAPSAPARPTSSGGYQRGHLHYPGRHTGAASDEQGGCSRCHSGRDPAAAGKVILPGFCCTHITKFTKKLWFFPKIRPYLFILCCKNYIIRVCPHIWKESVCAAAVNIWRRALLCSCTPTTPSICWIM